MDLTVSFDATVRAPSNPLKLYRALKEDENLMDHIDVVDVTFDVDI